MVKIACFISLLISCFFIIQATDAIYIPDEVIFCGEVVPLDKGDVAERLETQLSLLSQNTAQVKLWVKRKHRYFSWIPEILKEYDLPEDLKYIPVIESSLQNRAVSSMRATGPWQFIASTGHLYGLKINDRIDERMDPVLATHAAAKFLKDLYLDLKSWPTALAGYNAGQSRIRQECYEQGTANYYEMILPNETERYVFNAISAKIILENLQKYGIDEAATGSFPDPGIVKKSVVLKKTIPGKILAWAAGFSYREFRQQNPWASGIHIPAGTYTFNIAEITTETFESEINRYRNFLDRMVSFRHPARVEVSSDIAEMHMGPGFDYTIFRYLPKAESFRVSARTAHKDKGQYWYLYLADNGAGGWIWGGQIKK